MSVNIYTRNHEHEYGAQSIGHATMEVPQMVIILYILGLRESYMLTVATFDGLLLLAVLILALLASVPGIGTLLNIRHNSSEVIKLKNKKKLEDDEENNNKEGIKDNTKVMTIQEIVQYIYGPNAGIIRILFAAYF